MRNERYAGNSFAMRLASGNLSLPHRTLIGGILIIALFAFEIFNFDTTQFALGSLLGDVRFLGLRWASILAIAFCSIDFAGLVRLFTPEKGWNEQTEVWYLMGAWLLGATMNAMMTWWAVSLTLLNHNLGNEVLSRAELIRYVPVFVAVLVWLTRILFIGAFTVAGDHIFDFNQEGSGNGRSVRSKTRRRSAPARAQGVPRRAARARTQKNGSYRKAAATAAAPVEEELEYVDEQPTQVYQPPANKGTGKSHSRVRRRPPRPNGGMPTRLGSVHARSQNSRQ